jgi:predicted nucleic acid-binding protein
LILVDSSGLYAALVSTQAGHERVRNALEAERGPLLLSPFALAELDCMLARWEGRAVELTLLEDVAAGAYELVPFVQDDVAAALAVIERYRDLGIGLADASLVVLAGRYGTERILTLDERHFRVLRTPSGRPFTILPADA